MAEEKKNNKSVDEKDLKDVSGGGWWSAGLSYKSGDTPLFKVGDSVIVRRSAYTGSPYRKGTIKAVDDSKSGMINKEFTYSVKFEDGTTEDSIYESQMLEEVNGVITPITSTSIK